MDYRVDHSRLYIENPQITPNPPIILHSGAAHFFHKIFHTILKIFPNISKKDPFSHKSSFGSFKVKLDEHIYYVNKKSYLDWRIKTAADVPFEGSYAKDLVKMIKSPPGLEKSRKSSVNLDPASQQVPPDLSGKEKAENLEKEKLQDDSLTSSSEKNLLKTASDNLDLENPDTWLQAKNTEAFRDLPTYKLLEALRKMPLNFWMEVSALVENNLNSKQVAFEDSIPLLEVLGKCSEKEREEFSHYFLSKLPMDRLVLIHVALLSSPSLPISDRMTWISSAYKARDVINQAKDKYSFAWQLFDLCKKLKESKNLWKSLDDLFPKFAIEVFFNPCIVGILKYSKNPAEDFALFSNVYVFQRALPSNTQPSRFLEQNLTQDEKKKLLDVIYSLRNILGKKYEKVEFMNMKQPSYAGGDLLELIAKKSDFNASGSVFFDYLEKAYKDYTARIEERMRFSFDLLEAIVKRERDLNKIGTCFRELNIYKTIPSYKSVMPVFVRDCMAIALKNYQDEDRYKKILIYLKNNLIAGSSEIQGLFDPNVEDEVLNQILTAEEIMLLKDWKKSHLEKGSDAGSKQDR
ncbi:MAG: hypothetical protein BGO14_04460 [Chlamydiales bacterium 38-26]|nr:MAG: hypothetical protein BGO14_04460 [Chlamydiales bacterium 38-26]